MAGDEGEGEDCCQVSAAAVAVAAVAAVVVAAVLAVADAAPLTSRRVMVDVEPMGESS